MKNIINETINQYLLQEALTDVVYHFTNPYSLLKICQSNILMMSEAITGSADTMHKTKLFFYQQQDNLMANKDIPSIVRLELN